MAHQVKDTAAFCGAAAEQAVRDMAMSLGSKMRRSL